MELHSIAIPITESSQVGNVRRTASGIAERLGLNGTRVGQVAIIATEMANNLVLHAGGGTLLLRALATSASTGLEILALDKGCGMRDVARCLQDGYSTAGTPGNGLGAVRRLARVFDVYSESGDGTVVLAQIWGSPPESAAANATNAARLGAASKALSRATSDMEVGVVSVPKSGEEECGDSWAVHHEKGRHAFALADGLGHGPYAAEASREAIRVFRDNAGLSTVEILDLVHRALRMTRGAAMAVAVLDEGRGEVRYAGAGNIAGVVLNEDGSTRSMVSHNGTLGHEVRKLQEFFYPWPAGALLLMHSDGLGTQWQLERYRGLRQRHPSVVAGVLYRDYQRGRDDVTVLVARARNEVDDCQSHP